MKTFEIESIKGKRTILKQAESLQDAITWTQNHCDLSLEPWTVEEVPTPFGLDACTECGSRMVHTHQ